jgi:hypothetical protein
MPSACSHPTHMRESRLHDHVGSRDTLRHPRRQLGEDAGVAPVQPPHRGLRALRRRSVRLPARRYDHFGSRQPARRGAFQRRAVLRSYGKRAHDSAIVRCCGVTRADRPELRPSPALRSLGVGSGRTKTDQRDARSMSQASCRIDPPSVRVQSATARERRSQCTLRTLVGAAEAAATAVAAAAATAAAALAPTAAVAPAAAPAAAAAAAAATAAAPSEPRSQAALARDSHEAK